MLSAKPLGHGWLACCVQEPGYLQYASGQTVNDASVAENSSNTRNYGAL
jgi:hypothetical protein